MKLPELVENKLRDPTAIVLPRITPVKKGEMIICYHCDGKDIGETIFRHSPGAYADWPGPWLTSSATQPPPPLTIERIATTGAIATDYRA